MDDGENDEDSRLGLLLALVADFLSFSNCRPRVVSDGLISFLMLMTLRWNWNAKSLKIFLCHSKNQDIFLYGSEKCNNGDAPCREREIWLVDGEGSHP